MTAAILGDIEEKAAAAREANEVLRLGCEAAAEAGLRGAAIARAAGVALNTTGAGIAG